MEEPTKDVAKGCANVIAIWLTMVGLSVAHGLFNSYVLVEMWGWFITPTASLAVPSMATAYGLMLVVSLLTYNYSKPTKEQEAEAEAAPWGTMLERSATRALTVLSLWGIGYAVHSLWGAS